jgi:hypothetical protein
MIRYCILVICLHTMCALKASDDVAVSGEVRHNMPTSSCCFKLLFQRLSATIAAEAWLMESIQLSEGSSAVAILVSSAVAILQAQHRHKHEQ